MRIIQRFYDKIIWVYNTQVLQKTPMMLQIERWRNKGVSIGENCKIYSGLPMGRDSFLLSIGNGVTISGNVKILLHDNAPIKTSEGYTDVLGKVSIGNNCFIGYGSILLPGVCLADNTIVGAGSVVTKSVLTPGLCIAGNPAKIICTTEQYNLKNGECFVNLKDMDNKEVEEYFSLHKEKLINKKLLA